MESNNHGLTTIVQLRQLGYPNLFRKRSLNNESNKMTQEFGWKTTRTSKPLMIDDLGMALKNEDLILHCRDTIWELRTFTRNERGSLSGAPYDELVMAFAMADHMREYSLIPVLV